MKTNQPTPNRSALAVVATRLLLAATLAGAWSAPPSWGGEPGESQQSGSPQSDPWQVDRLLKPEVLVKDLSVAMSEKPLVLCVAFPLLYPNAHIVGSKFAGPGSNPNGIQKLKQEVEKLPRDKQIVLYCGCCPWKHCPNIRPAFRTLLELGFKNVRVLDLPNNFQQDWIAKGFPIQTSMSVNPSNPFAP